MTEKQGKTKSIILKVLSLVCLLVVIVSGFLPWVTLEGDYEETLLGDLTTTIDDMKATDVDTMKDFLKEQGIDFDIEGFIDSVEHVLDPITDGEIAIMDFLTLNGNLTEVLDYVYQVQEIEEFGEENIIGAEEEEVINLLLSIILVPVGLFGVLAITAALRFVLRLFNRRGLGVFVAILSALNALLMTGVAVLLDMLIKEAGSGSASITPVPVVVFVCSILGCVFWGNARKTLCPKKQKNVAEVPVPQNIPTPQNIPAPQGVPTPQNVEVAEEEKSEEKIEE